MLWKHFYQQQQQQQRHGDLSLLLDPGNGPLKSLEDLDAVCSQLSFSKDISRWMRHRTEAVCRNFFRLSVNSALHLCIPPANANTSQSLQQKQGEVQSQGKRTKDQESTGKELAPSTPPKFTTVSSLLDSILSQVAEPMLEKMTKISAENELSSRHDPQQQIVRSEWTRDRIRVLQEIVMQEKQGVERADFELDWGRIAERLERKLAGPAEVPSATERSDPAAAAAAVEMNPSAVLDMQHQERHPYISVKQCQDCWEYISSPAASSTFADLSVASVNAIDVRKLTKMRAEESGEKGGAGGVGGDDHHDLQDWTDHELQLLQQGVRKYGNAWTDVRAQFLPNKNLTDMYQTWQSISAPAEDGTSAAGGGGGGGGGGDDGGSDSSKSKDDRSRRAQVDRLAESDYASLLSALDRIGGKTGDDGSREGTTSDDADKKQ
ncbi:hypothetical protein EDD21DRAFT_379830 [Dissophora ornata]|nr:hypothetical protein EDD21DRAFT_379830 [Dissophora ornata]